MIAMFHKTFMIYDYDFLKHIGNTCLQNLSCVLHTFDDVVGGAYFQWFVLPLYHKMVNGILFVVNLDKWSLNA